MNELAIQLANVWIHYFFFFFLTFSGSFLPLGVLSANSCATFGLVANKNLLWALLLNGIVITIYIGLL